MSESTQEHSGNDRQAIEHSLEVLSQMIEYRKRRFARKIAQMRTQDIVFFSLQIISTVMTTILIGNNSTAYASVLKNWALASSAIASIMTVVLGRFRFRDRQIAYASARTTLVQIECRIAFLKSLDDKAWQESRPRDVIAALQSEFLSVLGKFDEDYLQILRSHQYHLPLADFQPLKTSR